MAAIEQLITTTAKDGGSADHAGAIIDQLDVWSSAVINKKSVGRGSSKKVELHGINKLRDLILGLGLSGSLCDSRGEFESPVDNLLVDIRSKYSKSINKKLKEYKLGSPIITEFNIPKNWEWKRVSDICDLQTGATPSTQHPEYYGGDIRWLVSGDINQGIIEDCKGRITGEGQASSNCKVLPVGTVMIALNGQGKTRATVALLNVEATCNQSLIGMIPFDKYQLDPMFLLLALRYRYFEIRDITGQNQRRGLNMGLVAELSIPLPPIEVQYRIVAKVDELMALCDQLEQQQENSITAHKTLVETLLAALTNAANKGDFNQAWARIAEHFDTLFTTEHSIDQLKQTILQLAVMGKLVPQNPNDEPASVLLEKIAVEKERLVKEKKIKKQKALPPIEDDENLFELPEGWVYARLGDLTSRLGSGSTPRGGQSAYVENGIIFLRSQNVWNDGLKLSDTAYISDETHKRMENTHVFPGDVLLNITGASLGRSTIFPEELIVANVSQHVTIIRLIEQLMGKFVHLGLLSPLVQKLVWGRQVGMAIEGLSKKVLELFEFPVPPLDEQHRIVAKVCELMTLCDTLKNKINISQTSQLHLADAIGQQLFGHQMVTVKNINEKRGAMKISTQLTLGSVSADETAIIAPLLSAEDGSADAKAIWSITKLELPAFYKQLKKEIKAGFITKPAQAEFEG